MIKQKVYLLPENLDQVKNVKICFALELLFSDWYLFQLGFLLKTGCNCLNTFILSWVDSVTTGTCIFVSVILNSGTSFASVPATEIHFWDWNTS